MNEKSKYQREDFLQDPQLDLEQAGSLLNAEDLRVAQDQHLLDRNLQAAFTEVRQAADQALAGWDGASFDKRLRNLLAAEDSAARRSAARYVQHGQRSGLMQLLLGNRLAQAGLAAAVIALVAIPLVLSTVSNSEHQNEAALSGDEADTWDGMTEELVGLDVDEHALGNSELDWVAARTGGSGKLTAPAPATEVAMKEEVMADDAPPAPAEKPGEEVALRAQKRSAANIPMGENESDAAVTANKAAQPEASGPTPLQLAQESRLKRQLSQATTDAEKKAALQKLANHYKTSGEQTKLQDVQRRLRAYP